MTDDALTKDQLHEMAMRIAALADVVQTQSQQTMRQAEQGVAGLSRAAQQVVAGGQDLSRQVVGTLQQQGQQAITQGLGQSIQQCQEQLTRASNQIIRASEQLELQRAGLKQQQRSLIWMGLLALGIGSLLAVGGSSYLVWKNMAELKRAEFGTDIMRATRAGVITRCGKQEALCVKVNKDAPRAGDKNEYILLEQ